MARVSNQKWEQVARELILPAAIGTAFRILLFVAVMAAFTSSCSTAAPITKPPAISWLVSHNMLADESGSSSNDLRKIEQQLSRFSHKDVAVVVTAPRSFDWGQSHLGEAIVFDPREEGDQNLIAYRLAHEWGHEVLAHEPTMYSPDGQTYRFRRSTAQEERGADLFAGDFMAQHGYSIDAACRQLSSYDSIPWDSRSSGKVRCDSLREGYQRAMVRIETGRKQQAKAEQRPGVSDFGPNGS
jgi:hypothetical protein